MTQEVLSHVVRDHEDHRKRSNISVTDPARKSGGIGFLVMLMDDDVDIRWNFLKLPSDLGGLLRISLVLGDFLFGETLRDRLLDSIAGGNSWLLKVTS